MFLGGSYEVHIRVLGGQLLKATVANDGQSEAVDLEPGTPVTLYLAPDRLRVLAASAPPQEQGAEETEPAEPVPSTPTG